jgi:hypothetical protein
MRLADISPHDVAAGAIHPTVEVSRPDVVRRRAMAWNGMAAESAQCTSRERLEYRFRAPVHLLLAYEEGERNDGETLVEGLPRSRLKNLARKLIFVPAGHQYREWIEPRTRIRRLHFYFDPATLKRHAQLDIAGMSLAPRLFFDDATLWNTAVKLKSWSRARRRKIGSISKRSALCSWSSSYDSVAGRRRSNGCRPEAGSPRGKSECLPSISSNILPNGSRSARWRGWLA